MSSDTAPVAGETDVDLLRLVIRRQGAIIAAQRKERRKLRRRIGVLAAQAAGHPKPRAAHRLGRIYAAAGTRDMEEVIALIERGRSPSGTPEP